MPASVLTSVLPARVRQRFAHLRAPRRTALRELYEHPAPTRSAFASFGTGSGIVPPARVSGAGGIEIGDGVVVFELSSLEVDAAGGARLVIGDGTHLLRMVDVRVARSVTIGRQVASSDYVTITDHWAPGDDPAPVVVEDGAYLGCGCVVGPGVTVGAGAFVGEGAIVVDDVPAHSVVYGSPARVVRQLRDGEWQGSRHP